MSTAAAVQADPSLLGLVDAKISRVLELARRHLQMDVAVLSEFSGGRQVYRALAGDGATFNICVGDGPDLSRTYCYRMASGDIPQVIPDTAAPPIAGQLPDTGGLVGSYLGVPLRLADGTLYGSFCAINHHTAALDDRDVGFMAMLGEVLIEELEAQRRFHKLHDDIQALLGASSITVALQPIVNLATGACEGAEALSRFATVGPPDVVFASAYEVGLGEALEELAARNAVNQLPRLSGSQYLSVNLSPAVAYRLAERGDDAFDMSFQRLVLEITEKAPVDSYALFAKRLKPLRDRGLRLAVDDAGAGYASLRHIVELQPDIIKIDRSLIHGIATDRSRRSAARALMTLAHDMGATVIAEGVETLHDVDTITSLGITHAQGYLFGRPSTDYTTPLAAWTGRREAFPLQRD